MKPFDIQLTSKAEIHTALTRGEPVYADVMGLPDRLPVREVKVSQGILKVRLMEGWRAAHAIYISHKATNAVAQTTPQSGQA